METSSEYTEKCPAAGSEVTLTETWEVENGCGCAVSAELIRKSCSRESVCPRKACEDCLLR